MGEIEFGAESNKEPNKYANLTAYDAYQQVLAADLQRNSDAFKVLVKNQDSNADGVLTKDELRLGSFQRDFQGVADLTLGRLLLEKYADAEGLLRGRFDKSRVAGVSSEDVVAFHLLGSKESRNQIKLVNKQEAELHRADFLGEGAKYGAAWGVAGSVVALGATRHLPAKFRSPLMLAAVASPVLGSWIGAGINSTRQDELSNQFFRDKVGRAHRLLDAGSRNGTIGAFSAYERNYNEGLESLLKTQGFEADVDRSGGIDREEARLARMTNTGNAGFNEYLNNNYADLELLSRSLDKNYDRGVRYQTFGLIFSERDSEFHFSAQESLSRAAYGRYALTSTAKNMLIWGGAGCAIAAASNFFPAKFRGAVQIGGALVGVLGFSSGVVSDFKAQVKIDEDFITNQRAALLRLHHNLKP